MLIYFNIIPAQYRFFVLLIISVLTLAITRTERWSLKENGIRFDNIKESILYYFILTFVALGAIFILARFFLHNNTQNIFGNIHFQYGFFILSFLQEFLFRSFLISKLKMLTDSPTLVIILNALLFGLIHIIFPNPLLLFIFSSLLGSGFALVYYFRPNLILATVAHSVINFAAVFYCFASFSSSCQ